MYELKHVNHTLALYQINNKYIFYCIPLAFEKFEREDGILPINNYTL